jgi:RNA polymerase sigma factor (sigma-70 family)
LIVIKRAKIGAFLSRQTDDDRYGSTLRALLVDRYGDLKSRLARRLGSADWAEEALQDTYLKLEGAAETDAVRNPMAYLFKAAFNTALNQRRSDHTRLSEADVEALLEIPDEAPDPLQILEARSDADRLKEILKDLPPRAREMLLAARLDGWTRQQIAAHFGLSVSLVEKELRWAQEYCASRFKKAGRS